MSHEPTPGRPENGAIPDSTAKARQAAAPGAWPGGGPPGAVAGLDPGRSKCGLVRTDAGCRHILEALVLPPEQAIERLLGWWRRGEVALVLIGDGTGSGAWRDRLQRHLPVVMVDERGTTLAARHRYWQLEPPGFWRRLLPEGLRQPGRDWDDVVAQLLVERWLARPLERHGPR